MSALNSPHGMLLSVAVTVAKLFVNNSNGRIGLVGYWDAVALMGYRKVKAC